MSSGENPNLCNLESHPREWGESSARERVERAEIDSTSSSKRRATADVLIELAAGAELWHTPTGDAYATVRVAAHFEHYAVSSRAMRRWLASRLWETEARAPSPEALRTAAGVLEAEAIFNGASHPTHVRVAPAPGGGVLLDLADRAWRAVHVTERGWSVVDWPAIRFRRARAMLPLPEPEPGGDLAELEHFLGGRAPADLALLIGWLVSALRPRGPYPVLLVQGEQGAGKSTTSRMLRRLVDPNTAELRAQPREPRDLAIAANNAWVIALDNLSGVRDWLSDALCRLATGGGFATRELFSDAEEVIFDAQRPTLLNGIDAVASRGDLLDRALLVTLPRVQEYRTEAELWDAFEAVRPRLLGALLDAVVAALHGEAHAPVPGHLRMADAARWVAAAEPALPWPPGTWLEAFAAVGEEGQRSAIEASPVGQALLELVLERGEIESTAGELLGLLEQRVGERAARARSWPRSPRGFSSELRRLAPALRALGVDVDFERRGHGRARMMCLRRGALDRPHRPRRPETAAAARSSPADGPPGPDGPPVADRPQNGPRTTQRDSSGKDGADDADGRTQSWEGSL